MRTSMSPEGLKAVLVGPAGVTLLDVRRRAAFEADPRVIPSAIWRDPETVDLWARDLPREMPVVVYCVHGHEVSQGVVDRLQGLVLDAALIEGGIEAWKASGGPTSEPPASDREVEAQR
jgi:thiosulfate sulfurtransferase